MNEKFPEDTEYNHPTHEKCGHCNCINKIKSLDIIILISSLIGIGVLVYTAIF